MNNYIYIISNKDWYNEKKYKYGFTDNLYNYIINNIENYSYLSKYIYIYEIINITNEYILPYKEYDKIISLLSRNYLKIEKIKKKYNYSFENLSIINNYLIYNGGSKDFINENGLNIFNNILLKEFNILGINIKKFNYDEINEINNNIILEINKIRKKYIKEKENEIY